MTDTASRVVMVSGASRGIGHAIALRLHRAGYCLSLGLRQPEALAGSELAESDRVQHVPYEATDRQAAKGWVDAVQERFGRVDALVNCAGVLLHYAIDDEDESALDTMLDINLKAPLRLTRAALPALRQTGSGRIINLVSMSGKRVKGVSAGYSISKYAEMAMTHATRNAAWDDGVRVTALCSSWVDTDMAQVSNMERDNMTRPEDVAELVKTTIELPNTAHLNEITVNCQLEV